jgi:hypothetical protein
MQIMAVLGKLQVHHARLEKLLARANASMPPTLTEREQGQAILDAADLYAHLCSATIWMRGRVNQDEN